VKRFENLCIFIKKLALGGYGTLISPFEHASGLHKFVLKEKGEEFRIKFTVVPLGRMTSK